jgi:hypothetical protein
VSTLRAIRFINSSGKKILSTPRVLHAQPKPFFTST